ncbi:uncharacterized protein LOC111055356 isoform X2 [Nilaparvata lugens]|uniref:uncharacterized protein LOC111055356 isoform X2 n=1 Tax=Nilaparvata lugens TaxID=108931 RepID=UPI00193E4289|nr:uncharacterized protein LOC111055356 isoform X2 [Nilaparvata lugens]
MLLKRTMTTGEVRGIVSALGYLPDGRRAPTTYSFTIFFILYSINLSFGLQHEWRNFKVRLEIIRNLVLLCNIQVYWLSVPDIYVLLDIYERHRTRLLKMKYFKKLTRKFYSEMASLEDDSQHFVRAFVVVSFCYTCLPVLNALYAKLTVTSAGADFKDLPQVSYLHYPVNGGPVTLTQYVCGAVFLYTGNLAASLFSFCFLYASYLALRCVAAAFHQLTALIALWDANVTQGQIHNDDLCLREIVLFHQQICRETRLLKKGIETATINLLQGCVVQLCLGLFSILEGGDKIKYGGFTCFVLLMLVGFSSFGQILEDRIGRVRVSIWDSDWVNRPYFTRKVLYTMMIGASARLELRPYGLQQLNMTSLANQPPSEDCAPALMDHRHIYSTGGKNQ